MNQRLDERTTETTHTHSQAHTRFVTANHTKPLGLRVRQLMLSVIAVGVLVSLGATLNQTLIIKAEKESELKSAKVAHQQAVEANKQANQAEKLVQDPEYLADVARRDYFYSKNGEILFVLPEEVSQTEVFKK